MVLLNRFCSTYFVIGCSFHLFCRKQVRVSSPGSLSIAPAHSNTCQQPVSYSDAQSPSCLEYFWGQWTLWWELKVQFLGDVCAGQHLRMPGKGALEMGVCSKTLMP